MKIPLDSRKLNKMTVVKRKAQMPNTEELISRISRNSEGSPADEKLTNVRNGWKHPARTGNYNRSSKDSKEEHQKTDGRCNQARRCRVPTERN